MNTRPRSIWRGQIESFSMVKLVICDLDDTLYLLRDFWQGRRIALCPDARSFLMRPREMKLCLFTQGDTDVQLSKIKMLDVACFFDFIMIRRTIGPTPKPIAGVIQLFGVLPEETVMIGDLQRLDLIPANEAGAMTIWMKREERMAELPDMDFEPDLTVDSFDELPECLEEWNGR